MLIGIISDTHDRVDETRRALALLAARNIHRIIHCGDVGGPPILDLLAGFDATLVWGNNDWDRTDLTRYARALNIGVGDPFADLTIDGKRFAVAHGDHAGILQRLIAGAQYDYLLTGHTHVRRDERIGRLRIINPGALHRASIKSVALLDVPTDRLEFLALPV